MNKPMVVSGEASETDSDDENCSKIIKANNQCFEVKGAVITGEDSESENENDASIASAISALNEYNIGQEETSKPQYESLLQQKLRESNIKLHQSMESYCQNVIGEADKNLHTIDQQLVKSQISLQGAVTSLKSLSQHSLTIKNKLQSLISANFIPQINVKK